MSQDVNGTSTHTYNLAGEANFFVSMLHFGIDFQIMATAFGCTLKPAAFDPGSP